MIAIEDIVTRYYLRLQVADSPGVLAKIAGMLGKRNISIASVNQHESNCDSVPLVILTHEAREGDMAQALEEVSDMAEVVAKPVMLRIEDLDS